MLEILESCIFSSRQSNHQNCSIVQETSTFVKLLFNVSAISRATVHSFVFLLAEQISLLWRRTDIIAMRKIRIKSRLKIKDYHYQYTL